MDQQVDITDMKGRGRIETGRIRFNDDWPGIFIRGDDAAAYNAQLYVLLEEMQKAGLNNHIRFVEDLIELMQSCKMH